MDPHLAELSRTIDPAELGRRIRNARVAAGMTQTAIAAGEVTAAYISRIEDGQRRPEFGLLGRLAERMGTTLAALLVDELGSTEYLSRQLALDHAELSLLGGEPRTALEALDSMEGARTDTSRRAQLIRAGALEATGDLNGAIAVLEDLTSTPSGDAGWLKALISLSRCYRDSGDFTRAIEVGERAQTTIEKLGIEGLTEAIQLTVTIAGAYVIRGDLDHAMRICQRALKQAERYDSAVGRASAYWQASIVQSTQGSFEDALAMGRRALALMESGEDARNLARLRAEIANMQLMLSPPDAAGALDTLAQVDREMAWSAASTYDVARTLLTRARAHFLLGDHVQASTHLHRCLEVAPPDLPLLRSSVLVLEGQIAAAEQRTAEARAAYQEAIATLTGIGADRGAAQLWFDLGGLLSELGDTDSALDAYRRAAASTGLTTKARPTRTVSIG